MKTLLKTLALVFILAATGCSKTCEPFYEGKQCDQRITNAYVGSYSGILTSTGSATQTYTVTNGTAPNEIVIGNLNATLSDKNYFTIPSQIRELNGALYVVSGSGQITASTLTFVLVINSDIAQFNGSK
jgi:hypothetical protein